MIDAFKVPEGSLPATLEEALRTFARAHGKARVYSTVTPYAQRMAALGRELGIRGSTLAYPFGGMDIATPFLLSDDITDVVSHGAQPFGSDRRIANALLHEADAVASPLAANESYDRTEAYARTASKYGCLGQQALVRIEDMLRGDVQRIARFTLDDGGAPAYAEDGPHAIVTFSVAGKERRFWYVLQELPLYEETTPAKDPTPAHRFFARLPAQTTLIKAAHRFWQFTEPVATHRLALAPAIARNDLVIADGNVSNTRGHDPFEERPIWRERPSWVDLDTFWGPDLVFGYDSVVQYGPGRSLITEDALPGRR